MTTVRYFLAQCAVHVKNKKHFIGYWHPKGTGIMSLDDKKADELMQITDVLTKLWENPDVYPLYVVTGKNGQYMLDEKSQVHDMLAEMADLAKGEKVR